MTRLTTLATEIAACRACPRLVAWREQVAREKRAAYREESYWGAPIAGFGDPRATVVIVGLAPAAHGANRTGRIFTGDRSGDFLFAALHRAGLASQPTSTARNDGLRLSGVFVTMPVRCAPPGNRPDAGELARCSAWLDREIVLLRDARVFVALGAIAWDAVLAHAARRSPDASPPRARFAHGGERALGLRTLVGSYHVSQQNTQTGRLTAPMFDAVLARALELV